MASRCFRHWAVGVGLWAAGAEAIEINDRVRVIAQTSFEDDDGGIRVDLIDRRRLAYVGRTDEVGADQRADRVAIPA